MLINMAYMIVGIFIGFLIYYELDIKYKKRRLSRRIAYAKSFASSPTMQQYDDILKSIKSVNEGLSSSPKHHQREV